MLCLKSAPKLKGTKIFINEDLSRATLDIRRRKLDELKEIRAQGYIAYFRGINIITKAKTDNTRDVSLLLLEARKRGLLKNPANLSISFSYCFSLFILVLFTY